MFAAGYPVDPLLNFLRLLSSPSHLPACCFVRVCVYMGAAGDLVDPLLQLLPQ